MNRNNILYLALILLSAGSIGCSKNNPDHADIRFELLDHQIFIPAEKGSTSIAYKINFPIEENREHIKEYCKDYWIHSFSYTKDSVIFHFDANSEKNERTTTVKLSYADITQSFTVVQAANEPDDFIIQLQDITPRSVSFDIIPADKDMTYVSMLIELAERVDDEVLLQDDMYYFEMMAAMYGLSLEEYLTRFKLKTGDRLNVTSSDLKPDTDYLLYAYGMSPKGEYLTDIFKEEFRTVLPDKLDISFKIEYQVDATSVSAKIEPSQMDCLYLFECVELSSVSNFETTISDYQLELLETVDYYEDHGMTAADYINTIAMKGNDVKHIENLQANTQYIGFAVAVNPNTGLLISDASTKGFTSGAVEPSDNIITLTLKDISSRSAEFKITTTNDDPYVFGISEARYWTNMSDEQIIEQLLQNYDLQNYILRGDSEQLIKNLSPDTEYAAFAFGYVSGTATTNLANTFFTTTKAEIANASFQLSFEKYFNGDEAAALYPEEYADAMGKALLPVHATTSGMVAGYYYGIYEGDHTGSDAISDEEVIAELLISGSESENMVYYLPFGKDCTSLGVAVDYEGNFSPVERIKINLDTDHVSPISEFIPSYYEVRDIHFHSINVQSK